MKDLIYDLLWTPHWWDGIAGLVVFVAMIGLTWLGIPNKYKP